MKSQNAVATVPATASTSPCGEPRAAVRYTGTMPEAWRDWLGMADNELRDARGALDAGFYQMVAFFSHQIAELSLKALWVRDGDGLPPRTNNLVELTRGTDAPETVIHAARKLNPHYRASRYPDAANGNPADNYDAAIAGEALARAEEVHAWCSARLRN